MNGEKQDAGTKDGVQEYGRKQNEGNEVKNV